MAARKVKTQKKTQTKVAPKKALKSTKVSKKVAEVVMTDSVPNKSTKSMKQRLVLPVVVLALAGLLYLTRSLFVVALVNGYPVSRMSVVKELEAQGGKQVLDGLVTKRLILDEAKKSGVTVSEDEIDVEVDRIKKLAEAQGLTLENALSYQGQTMDQLLENIRLQKTIEKILGDKVSVSDEDIKKYFDENKDAYTGKKLEEVKEEIASSLKNQKLSAEYQTWITDLKTNSKIQYIKTY